MCNQYYVNQVNNFHHKIKHLANQCLIISSYVNQLSSDSGVLSHIQYYNDRVSGMVVSGRVEVGMYAEYMQWMYDVYGYG